MKYIYTTPGCPRCEKLKREYREQGIDFEERDVKQLTPGGNNWDNIDVDGHVQLLMQGNVLPVEVEDNKCLK